MLSINLFSECINNSSLRVYNLCGLPLNCKRICDSLTIPYLEQSHKMPKCQSYLSLTFQEKELQKNLPTASPHLLGLLDVLINLLCCPQVLFAYLSEKGPRCFPAKVFEHFQTTTLKLHHKQRQ